MITFSDVIFEQGLLLHSTVLRANVEKLKSYLDPVLLSRRLQALQNSYSPRICRLRQGAWLRTRFSIDLITISEESLPFQRTRCVRGHCVHRRHF